MSWDWEISGKTPWFKLGIRELFHHKDLILRFSKRDLLATYQQTLIGPLWVVLQPILTTLTFVMIFSRIARIGTDGVPPFLFYLPGVIMWNYFSECLNGTMNTFQYNAHIFNKVFFPRLTVPISQMLTYSFRMLIQLVVFVIIYFIYRYNGYDLSINAMILMLPITLFVCAGFAFGAGLMISVLTAKYRDLDNILQFALRLFMFATPVIYPSSIVPADLQWLFWLNPLTPAIEILRNGFFGSPDVAWSSLSIAILMVTALSVIGLIVFKQNEVKVMDTV